MLPADFPLSNRRGVGIQHRRQHRLTEVVARPELTNLQRGIVRDRRQAQGLVFPHLVQVDEARLVPVRCRFMKRLQVHRAC